MSSDLHDEIVGVAIELSAHIVVLSTHRYEGWKHLIFGSDTDDLLFELPCQVLVVPAKSKR